MNSNLKKEIPISACCLPKLQIFELKQLAEMENDYRKKSITAISEYKKWRKQKEGQEDIIVVLYGNLEGIVLRRNAEEAVKAYWVIRTDFRRGFKDYIEHHCS